MDDNLLLAQTFEEYLNYLLFTKPLLQELGFFTHPTKLKKKHNFMTPFYGWGSTASRLQPLPEGFLIFTTKFPGIHGNHFIDLGRMKG